MMQRHHDLLFDAPSEEAEGNEEHAFFLHQQPVPVTFEHDPDLQIHRRYLAGNALLMNHTPYDKATMKGKFGQGGECGFCTGSDRGTTSQ